MTKLIARSDKVIIIDEIVMDVATVLKNLRKSGKSRAADEWMVEAWRKEGLIYEAAP